MKKKLKQIKYTFKVTYYDTDFFFNWISTTSQDRKILQYQIRTGENTGPIFIKRVLASTTNCSMSRRTWASEKDFLRSNLSQTKQRAG